MRTPRWWSQPFPAEGSQTGSGIRRQLGRTELDHATVLVREAVQNSWDARLPGGAPIRVRFSLDRLGNRAVPWHQHLLDAGRGPDLGDTDLRDFLTSDQYLLTISDRGTVGLGGPLRANEPIRPGQVANFVQFVRNVGEPRDQDLGGGTYGFGKSIFYRMSRCGVILIRSRCSENEPYRDRLIGAALGEVFTDAQGLRHTGRHWWGVLGDDGIPDPIVDEGVAAESAMLGLPPREDGPGTDVVVVAPQLEQEGHAGARKLGEEIAAAIVWNLWPKFGSAIRPRQIEFEVLVDGEQIPIPEISDLPLLAALAECLDEVQQMGTRDPRAERRKSPPYLVGKLALKKTLGEFPRGLEAHVGHEVLARCPLNDTAQGSGFRHVARMRAAELVVDYLPCAPFKLQGVGYVGVYKASDEADMYFADAEPPTHDSWQPAGLSGTARGVIVGHKSFIKKQTELLVGGGDGAPSKAVQGLGRIASALGALINTSTGTTPMPLEGNPVSTKNRAGVKKARVSEQARVELVQGQPVVRARVEIPRGAPNSVVRAVATIILAGGTAERDRPATAGHSQILRWVREDGSQSVPGDSLRVEDGQTGTWIVEAKFIPDAAVRVSVVQEGQ